MKTLGKRTDGTAQANTDPEPQKCKGCAVTRRRQSSLVRACRIRVDSPPISRPSLWHHQAQWIFDLGSDKLWSGAVENSTLSSTHTVNVSLLDPGLIGFCYKDESKTKSTVWTKCKIKVEGCYRQWGARGSRPRRQQSAQELLHSEAMATQKPATRHTCTPTVTVWDTSLVQHNRERGKEKAGQGVKENVFSADGCPHHDTSWHEKLHTTLRVRPGFWREDQHFLAY